MAKTAAGPATNLDLFPVLQGFPPSGTTGLSGIARLAAEATPAGEGHLLEVRSLNVRSILNRSVSRRGLRFAWSINPYRGCEFACRYCYARYTHEFMEMRQSEDFERKIFVKDHAAWLLEQELKQVRPGEEIALGTATDPYQPLERQAKVTQSLLEVLARKRGLRLGLVTKSTLIERDIPLLQEIARNNTLVLHVTITTPNATLARLLEPRAPRPDLRLQTVARLRNAGLTTGILCSPLLPGITDTGRALDGMAKRAKAADASFFSAQPLFLKPCSKHVYLAFVKEHFPALETMYQERFASEAFVSKTYRRRMDDLVVSVCNKHALARRSSDALLTRALGQAASDLHLTDAVSGCLPFPTARTRFASSAPAPHRDQAGPLGQSGDDIRRSGLSHRPPAMSSTDPA